jgi:hypothetical protein
MEVFDVRAPQPQASLGGGRRRAREISLVLASRRLFPAQAAPVDGWSARDIYLVQDALDADPAAFPSRTYGPEFAMIYVLGRRAALKGLSLKRLPWRPNSQGTMTGVTQEWIYLTGFLDALADKAFGTDRVPPEV